MKHLWDRFVTPKVVETSVVAKIKTPAPFVSLVILDHLESTFHYDYFPAIVLKNAVEAAMKNQEYWDSGTKKLEML